MMTQDVVKANTILQTHPDVWCTQRGKISIYARTENPRDVWVLPTRTWRILEAFRSPTRVRRALGTITHREIKLLEECREAGLIQIIDAQYPLQAPSDLTRALFGLASQGSSRRASAYVTRHERIDGKDIFVLDNLYTKTEIAAVDRFLKREPVRLDAYAGAAATKYNYYGKQLPIDLPFFDRIETSIRQLFPQMKLQRFMTMCNANRYGDQLVGHRDSQKPSVTGLYFANKTWDLTWLGETVFFDDKGEPRVIVAPRPGRVILFRGDLLHRGGTLSRSCYQTRMTVALQTESAA